MSWSLMGARRQKIPVHPRAEIVDPDPGKVGSTPAITVMVSPTLKNGSQSHCRHQWVKHNRFSPLSELGNEMGTEFGEGGDRVEAFSDYHEVVVRSRSVASVGFSHNDSGLLFLPWDNSGANNCGGGSGVKDNCLLECNPLTRWDPNTHGEVVLVQDDAN